MEGARDHRFSNTLRIISTIVLSFFLWTFGGLFDIAYAVKNSDQLSASSAQRSAAGNQTATSSQPKAQKPEEKFGKDMEDLESILKDDKSDHESKKQKIKTKKAEIDADDIEIRKQFKETEEKIKSLPGEIWKRHKDFVMKYDDNLKELRTNLDDIDKAKTDKEKELAHKKAKDFVEKVKAPKKHQKLDPNKLPHRTEEPVWKEPRTKPEEFTEGKQLKAQGTTNKPILIASNGPLMGLISKKTAAAMASDLPEGSFQIALATPPTSADLAETIEVQFTPEIVAKAAELGNNPVKIYNWVRNNIEYVPTYGSIQGANMCLQTKLCNDFDTASLLIALLRASGIHARYVYGTIELPIEKVRNWVGGFTDTNAALTLIASGGIPVTGLTSGGKVEMVRMEHFWVEAWIDYIPSRGEIHKQGDTWISLDASFKQYTYSPGIDINTVVPFDVQTFTDQLKATSTIDENAGYVINVDSNLIKQNMTSYQAQVQSYVSQNYPGDTVGDVVGKREVIKQEFRYFLGTLPYRITVKGGQYSTAPDNLRHKLTIIVRAEDEFNNAPALTVTKAMADLAGKRITLNYLPASGGDADVLALYGYYSAPPYLVSLKPVIFIEGVQETVGNIVGMGSTQSLEVLFQFPCRSSDRIIHKINASAMVAIGLDSPNIPASLLEKRKAKLDAAVSNLGVTDVGFDDIIGELLNLHALSYFAMVEMANRASSLGRIVYSKQIAEMAAMINPSVDYLYGMPYRVNSPSLGIDVKRYVMARQSLRGIKTDEISFSFQAGLISSALEHGVLELLNEGGKAVSSIKILSVANDSGIPIYTMRDANSSVLPNLEVLPETQSDIRNAIAAGKEVIVPQKSIQYYQWGGDGYIVYDPKTGAGSFLITGGLLGGSNACNLYAKSDLSNYNLVEYLKYGSHLTLAGGTDVCKNYAYDLSRLLQQTRDQLVMWAAKAETVSPDVARTLTRYSLTVGVLAGALIQIATNWDKIGQLSPSNKFFAIAFISSLTFLTSYGLVWLARAGAERGGFEDAVLMSVGLIVISNGIMTIYLDWLLSMQQAAFLPRRRYLYADLNVDELGSPA